MRRLWRPSAVVITALALPVPLLAATPALAATAGTAATATAAAAAADGTAAVRINEVESSGGTPGDWIELVNTGSAAADLSGLVLKDNDDSHAFILPTGTSIAVGAFLAVDVDVKGGFGLGAADSARLFSSDGSTLLDSYSWTAHATTTYGRIPDGTGDFTTTGAPTKGAANISATTPPTTPPTTP
ncbi:lamin tail domain-containing protein, partial [Herbiconiux solani]|uniref:lamin tail domain-containing protein n=1 Tax=Herbiconiux solani TaxID=661329 RepID=UPI001471D047